MLGGVECGFKAVAYGEVIGQARGLERAGDRAMVARDDAQQLSAFARGSLGLDQ